MSVVMADIESVITKYLRAAFAGLEVHVKPSTPLPAEQWLQVRRVGGSQDSLVSSRPRIDVFTWGAAAGTDDATTCALALQVEASLLWDLPRTVQSGSQIYRVGQFLGPTPIPDPDTGRSRYLQTIEPRLRGTER